MCERLHRPRNVNARRIILIVNTFAKIIQGYYYIELVSIKLLYFCNLICKALLNLIFPTIALIVFNLSLYRKTRNLPSGVDSTALAIIGVSLVCILPRIVIYAIFWTKNIFGWDMCQWELLRCAR